MRVDMDDGDDISVDMGPLIDCVFLLLIFFLGFDDDEKAGAGDSGGVA
jgi:hypothetical protein